MPFPSIVHHLSGPNRCAHTQTSLNRLVGCWCRNPSSHFHCALWFVTCELAHMLDSLVRVSRRVAGNHLVSKQHTSAFAKHIHKAAARLPCPWDCHTSGMPMTRKARSTAHARLRPAPPLALRKQAVTIMRHNLAKANWFHALPFQQVQALLTLFPKSFSSFPHGTCLLSVSSLYLALDEIYHPICAPIPRNTTLRRHAVHEGLQVTYGILTLIDAFSKRLTPAPPLAMPLQTTIQGRRPRFSS